MIRLAIPDDGPAIMPMGEAFHAESGWAEQFPFDRESFAHTVTRLGMADLFVVAEKEGRIVGMAAIDIGPAITNHSVRFAREVFFYVQPLHRKGIGRDLFNALKLIARHNGVTFFDAVAEEGKRSLALARIYRAGGLSPAETIFRMRLEPCQSHQFSAA